MSNRTCIKDYYKIIILHLVIFLITSSGVFAEWKPASALKKNEGKQPILVQVKKQAANSIEIQYKTPVIEFSTNGYQKINGEATVRCKLGNVRLYTKAGEPQIGYIFSRVILPYRHTVDNIEVIAHETVECSEKYLLSYGEKLHRMDAQKIEWAKANRSIYKSYASFPGKTYDLI